MSTTIGNTLSLFKKAAFGSGKGSEKVNPSDKKTQEEEANYFTNLYSKKDEQVEERKKNAPKMVEVFYDLVTDFYETGWGQSFHFAPRGRYETFRESIARHEYFIAHKIGIKHTDVVLDAGCGIGGPMRNITQFTHPKKIIGITINDYQVKRGNNLNKLAGLDHLCELQRMNYLEMTFKDNIFDKCFSIEATCHSGNRQDVFKEIYRVLKPGGLFASYEWVINSNYNDKNALHRLARQEIEEGNALPQLVSDEQVLKDLQAVGFEIVESYDLAEISKENGQTEWYKSLEAGCTIETFHHSWIAGLCTHYLCWTMETIGLAPKGTVKTHEFLIKAKDGLVKAGRENIFTPMFFILVRKPLK